MVTAHETNQEVTFRPLRPLLPFRRYGKGQEQNIQCAYAMHIQRNKILQAQRKENHVNIAIFMLDDAYQDLCDNLVLVSGDSDLVPAIRMIRHRYRRKKQPCTFPAPRSKSRRCG